LEKKLSVLTAFSGISEDISQPVMIDVRYVQHLATFGKLYPPESKITHSSLN